MWSEVIRHRHIPAYSGGLASLEQWQRQLAELVMLCMVGGIRGGIRGGDALLVRAPQLQRNATQKP